MKLALFDLDHTLLPFDSGMAWTQFLVERGLLPAEAEENYLGYCRQYVAGTLDIHAMHFASVAPLAGVPRARLLQWTGEFEQALRPRVPAEMNALVRRHLQAGDLCALVTATTRFIAEPCARLFGIEHVVATETATVDGTPGGTLTGAIDGLPCFREHKLTRVVQWLTRRRQGDKGAQDEPADLAAFEQSYFYSDSASDLPLLGAVSNPVAVRPDARLRAHALSAGWPVLEPPDRNFSTPAGALPAQVLAACTDTPFWGRPSAGRSCTAPLHPAGDKP
ncbi:MAG TPA: HAD family phosphatase [Burkholderiaceae bacterium]|jgi:HAD superfamily hydrolase (TIGR01490 family)